MCGFLVCTPTHVLAEEFCQEIPHCSKFLYDQTHTFFELLSVFRGTED